MIDVSFLLFSAFFVASCFVCHISLIVTRLLCGTRPYITSPSSILAVASGLLGQMDPPAFIPTIKHLKKMSPSSSEQKMKLLLSEEAKAQVFPVDTELLYSTDREVVIGSAPLGSRFCEACGQPVNHAVANERIPDAESVDVPTARMTHCPSAVDWESLIRDEEFHRELDSRIDSTHMRTSSGGPMPLTSADSALLLCENPILIMFLSLFVYLCVCVCGVEQTWHTSHMSYQRI